MSKSSKLIQKLTNKFRKNNISHGVLQWKISGLKQGIINTLENRESDEMREWENERMREWENERMREWENERMREWENERMREWENERMREWENERMSEFAMLEFQSDRGQGQNQNLKNNYNSQNKQKGLLSYFQQENYFDKCIFSLWNTFYRPQEVGWEYVKFKIFEKEKKK